MKPREPVNCGGRERGLALLLLLLGLLFASGARADGDVSEPNLTVGAVQMDEPWGRIFIEVCNTGTVPSQDSWSRCWFGTRARVRVVVPR